MNINFSGGAMEIGGSCIYIRIAGKGILLDSGIRQSGAKDPLPDFRTIQEQGGLDAIIISHAHMDHIGTLPIISKAYSLARIYMTAMTADLTRVLLYDSLKIMKYREDEIPHYSEQDVLSMLSRVYPIGYQTPFTIFDQFTLTFYPAGHIAGAACIYLVTVEGSLFYSGDFSAFAQRTIEGIRIPNLRPDVAIVETTYGSRLHANRQVEERRLTDLVKECIQEKKKILIPAFALGRAQEVLLILRAAIQNQEIPPVAVYVDGMVRDINTMYTRNPTYLRNNLGKRILKGNEPFYTKEIQPVAASQKRDELLSGSDPVIFLSSSGMLTGGPSAWYASRLASSEDACIIITGYQDEESPGRQLLNLLDNPEERRLNINGVSIPVKCRIEQVGLSAHGDKSEITALLERLSARRIFLVHGNREVIEELGNELASADYRRQVYLPECGQSYEIILHNKRKQLNFTPHHTMQMNRPFTSQDEKRLWDYWQEHYNGKALSVSQIALIWYGNKHPLDESVLQEMQEIFLHSSYFSPNSRRLFLFEANTAEEIRQALTPRELTQQELNVQVEMHFSEYPYRKISYHIAQKEILLQFDYPDAQDTQKFQTTADAFFEETGWNIHISPSMNHNAASLLLSVLFENTLSKTSYYPEKKCYAVTLISGSTDSSHRMSPDDTDSSRQTAPEDADSPRQTAPEDADSSGHPVSDSAKEAAETFRNTTGWDLLVNGRNPLDSAAARKPDAASDTPAAKKLNSDFFLPSDTATEKAEQNLAFFCIDQTFEGLPHQPDKKSLRNDSQGSFLEVSFISPVVGRRYCQELQSLADQTGWRFHIAEKINQNALFREAQLLCMKYGIVPLKNPSYLPERRTIQLAISSQQSNGQLQEFSDVFEERTGCKCTFVTK